MNATKYRIALFSDNPDKLADFYINVLKFKQVIKVDTTDDYGFSIEVASGYKLWVGRHSEISGKNTNPLRIMISIYVDNINEYFEAIKQHSDVRIINNPNLNCVGIKGEERYVGAFLDPDGNCIQLMQITGC